MHDISFFLPLSHVTLNNVILCRHSYQSFTTYLTYICPICLSSVYLLLSFSISLILSCCCVDLVFIVFYPKKLLAHTFLLHVVLLLANTYVVIWSFCCYTTRFDVVNDDNYESVNQCDDSDDGNWSNVCFVKNAMRERKITIFSFTLLLLNDGLFKQWLKETSLELAWYLAVGCICNTICRHHTLHYILACV